jgi:[ribosomal protein S5]-alanine N-acetyltransferase
MMEKIISKNIYLRQFQPKDITDEYIASLNNQNIVGLTEARHRTWNPDDVKKYVKESNKENFSLLVGIFLNDNDKHIGNIRLFNFHYVHKRVELGIMIYDTSQWSKGLGTEAILAVEQYVFSTLRYHKICADYYSVNKASARMFEKAGYIIEGTFKDHFFLHDRYVDSVRIAKFNPNEKQYVAEDGDN